MTTSPADRRACAAALALLALAGCSDAPAGPDAARGRPSAVELGLPATAGPVGERVHLPLHVPEAGTMAVQGRVTFDTADFRFVGQAPTSHLVLAGDSAESGVLRFVALRAGGLPREAATFVLERRRPVAATPRAEVQELVDAAARPRRALLTLGPASAAAPGDVVRPRAADWLRLLALEEPAAGRRRHVAGDGLVYGDANLSGTVTGADYVAIANAAVGNLPLLALENRDFAIAANVAPANLPGLGEAGDPAPPGRNPDGSFTITIADAAVVANRIVGQPVAVAGEPVPGRAPALARVVLRDSIVSSRTLTRDTVYELEGRVVVGSPDSADVTLTIEAGTRLEGDPATRAQLVIRRGANLVALGTRLQPVVFTCRSAMPAPGCWGGVVINGFGVLNNGETGGGGGVGLPNKEGLGGSGRYGGSQPEDSSGALRYVRIEYAGAFPESGADRLPGLQLLGVGSRTVLDTIQVHASGGDGILVSGGTARLRATVVTAALRDGLVWADGWQGAAQFLVVQQPPGARHALHGVNFAASPDAAPRSSPVLANVTLVGPADPAPGSRALLLEHGSAGTLVNAIVLRAAEAGFDVEGAASCALLGDAITVRASVFRNAPGTDATTDADCADEAAELGAAGRDNRFVDPLLVAGLATRAPDWRPVASSPAVSGASTLVQPSLPPAFFLAEPGFVGAVAPANLIGSNVPWFAGWTRTF